MKLSIDDILELVDEGALFAKCVRVAKCQEDPTPADKLIIEVFDDTFREEDVVEWTYCGNLISFEFHTSALEFDCISFDGETGHFIFQ